MSQVHMTRNDWLRLGVVLAVFIAAVALIIFPLRPADKIVNLGLDLQGGVRLVLEPEGIESMDAEQQESTLDQVIDILSRRTDEYGLANTEIRKQSSGTVVVSIPGAQDPDEAKQLIGQTAALTFHWVIEAGAVPTDELIPTSVLHQFMRDRNGIPYIIEAQPVLVGSALENATVSTSSSLTSGGMYLIRIELTDEGSRQFASMIRDSDIGDRLAIVLDGTVYSAPLISDDIMSAALSSGNRGIDEASITNIPTRDEATLLAVILRSGQLPVALNIVEEQTVGPSLGSDSIRRGMMSIVIGFVIILLYMLLYYRLLGLVADAALVLNMLIVIGALVVFKATLTLPGIAGIILTIGMTVDANVIIFERIKEEHKTGKSPLAAVRAGFEKSLSTLMDANITTLLTALMLLLVGTGTVRGFAITLMIGVIGSLFCALVASRLLLEKTSLARHIPQRASKKAEA